MFTKVNGKIELASGAPEEARIAASNFGHLMNQVDHFTADNMADAIDLNYDNAQAQAVSKELRKWTTTVNIMNPAAGAIAILKDQKGGCCDVGMERYWSM